MKWSDWFWRVSLSFSAIVFVFVAGLSVEHYQVFPYRLIHNAAAAFKAIAFGEQHVADGPLEYKQNITQSLAQWHTAAENKSDECILMTLGSIAFLNLNPDGALAQLIDREGKVLHQWNYDQKLWNDLVYVTRISGVSGAIGPASLHMFDNGDILVSFHGYNTFPYAIGLAKFDKDSNLVWKRENFCHHSFTVTEDGRIFVPSMEVVDGPVSIGSTAIAISSLTNHIYRDVILELNSGGDEISRMDIMNALAYSGWAGQFIRGNMLQVESEDPMHLNDVRLVGKEFADQHDWLAPSDLLISLRNLNCLAIVDYKTARIKWISNGAMIGQHSPRTFKDGILALDNLGGDKDLGGTRLVKIDLNRGIPVTVFPLREEDLPDSMRTINSGYLDVSQDGKRVLVAVTHAGTIWEIDIDSGKVQWEFIAGTDLPDRSRLKVGFAKYVTKPKFLTTLMSPQEK